jgi:hypothetical protein
MTRARTHQLLTVLLLAAPLATPLATPAAASPAHTPPDDDHASRAMLDLRSQLFSAGREKAQASIGRFRALCDKDGYPLVGNMTGKTGIYQPSEFCSDVRKRENRS